MTTLTLEQFLKHEETKPASEYACGEVYQKPTPDGPHGALQLFLGMILSPLYLWRDGTRANLRP
jgi:Uma2 family endonuclease